MAIRAPSELTKQVRTRLASKKSKKEAEEEKDKKVMRGREGGESRKREESSL